MSRNTKKKLIRIEDNIKNAKKSNGKTNKKTQVEQMSQYSMTKSRSAIGIARSNQDAINGINTNLDDIWGNINNLSNQINDFNTEMKRYDAEEVKPIVAKQNVLIDLFIQIANKLDIEIDNEQLDMLGLEYEEVDNDERMEPPED